MDDDACHQDCDESVVLSPHSTVADLIAALQKFPPHLPVVAADRICYTHIEISRERVTDVDWEGIDLDDAVVL